MAMQKLFIKKRNKKRRVEKNKKVFEILKTWILRCPPEKSKR
jgi:hypothetical protein